MLQLPANFSPTHGIVLGSGLGDLLEECEIIRAIPYADIPQLPESAVPGHAGRFVCARLRGHDILAAQGRVHLYEGWSGMDVSANIRCLATAGVQHVILTNAAGTLNPEFTPGSWMMLSDHLNLTGASALNGPQFVDMTEVYSLPWRKRFQAMAKGLGITLHEGVYAGLRGPQYETPAEIRMLRLLGADAVGMSTVLEAIQARALGMDVTGFSCLTNWAAGLNGESLDHSDVLEMSKQASKTLFRLLIATLAPET